jgi:hypothetical protein
METIFTLAALWGIKWDYMIPNFKIHNIRPNFYYDASSLMS